MENRGNLKKAVVIVLLIAIAVVIFLIRGCEGAKLSEVEKEQGNFIAEVDSTDPMPILDEEQNKEEAEVVEVETKEPVEEPKTEEPNTEEPKEEQKEEQTPAAPVAPQPAQTQPAAPVQVQETQPAQVQETTPAPAPIPAPVQPQVEQTQEAPAETPAPVQTAHVHDWITETTVTTETVKVIDKEACDEVVREAYTETIEEPIYERHMVCSACGAFLETWTDDAITQHEKKHALNGEASGDWTGNVQVGTNKSDIHHEAEIKHHDEESHNETKETTTSIIKCSTCGEIKETQITTSQR